MKNEKDENPTEEKNTLKVEIVSNWSLMEILGDWRRVWRIIAALVAVIIAIFICVAVVTISLKRAYPYNDVKINMFGATTLENEDTEVIYWLFNTADLWANSGIRVEAGDRLTIRASGRFHTAIHHLYEDALDNVRLRDDWVDTDGERPENRAERNSVIEKRDKERMKFRIFPNMRQSALLMQVIDERHDLVLHPNEPSDPTPYNIEMDQFLVSEENFLPDYSDDRRKQKKENFYFIGKEREDLMIYNDGILHFAVNDIVLTHKVIDSMLSLPKDRWDILDLGPHPYDPEKFEVDYYRETGYFNAWFDDNVGSFLIVIERKKSR